MNGDARKSQFARDERRDFGARPQTAVVRRLLQANSQLRKNFGGENPRRRAVTPTQIAQRIRPFHIVANNELFDPTPAERGHLGDVADAVTLGEKLNRLKMPRLHDVGARNIPIT